MELLASVDAMVLRLDTSNCLIDSIGFHDCFKGSIELGEDESTEKSCSEFVKGLLLCISTSEENIVCQVEKGSCFGTVVNDKSTTIICKG